MSAKTNLTASIRDRLLNRAKADKVEFQQMLTRFALERLLYRLSISPHRDGSTRRPWSRSSLIFEGFSRRFCPSEMNKPGS